MQKMLNDVNVLFTLQMNLDLATPLPESSDLDSSDNEQIASTTPKQKTKAKIPVKVVLHASM